jgi:uncharacterized BrkB/YihY/UPF0761 family membrane protein
MHVNRFDDVPDALTIKTSHYAIGALSFVAALSWNESITQAIKKMYEVPEDYIWMKFVYSIVITMVLILVIYLLPDTTTELPIDTQAAVNHSKTIETIKGMRTYVDTLQKQNVVLSAKVLHAK